MNLNLELFYLAPCSSISGVPGGKGGDVTQQSWVEMWEPSERCLAPPVASCCGPNVYALPLPSYIETLTPILWNEAVGPCGGDYGYMRS